MSMYNQHVFDADLEFIDFKPGQPNLNTKQKDNEAVCYFQSNHF